MRWRGGGGVGGVEGGGRCLEGVCGGVCGEACARREPDATHSLFIVAQTKKTKKLRRHIICANRSSVKSLRM